MKITFLMVSVALVSTSLLADDATTMLPAGTTPATNIPARAPARKSAGRQAAAELRTVPLVPGPAVVAVGAGSVNVRGQARLKSEVITRVTNGEPVTVIEEIRLNHSGPEEPSAWAKIMLPDQAHVWVHASYIDVANKTVIPKRLNIRGGPGENFSILGTLEQGEPVKEIVTKGNWIEIEPPTNAYAFMAAQYLKQEIPAEAVAAAPAEPAPTPAAVAEAPTVAPAPAEAPAVPEAMTGTNEMAMTETNQEAAEPAEAPVVEPLPPRIVQREGMVRNTVSIQAPTDYELINLQTRRPMDYLYTTSTNLDLSRYKGLRIIVTGEEGLDERWKNTPVITIHRIQVIE
jgi:uncharacterized protein YgiM (DUF1202 family)